MIKKIFYLIFVTILIFSVFRFLAVEQKEFGDDIEYEGKDVSLTIESIGGQDYKGKAMIVKAHKPGSIKLALARGGLGSTETVSSMARRTGAVAAVNGGGFYNLPVAGKLQNYPVYITIHEGQLVHVDRPVRPLVTVGLDKDSRLVYSAKGAKDLLSRGVQEAVSFKPPLIVNGRPMIRYQGGEIGPRTAIGQRKNGDLIFVVIDGRQANWSEGVTLYQLMKIMQSLKAYNAFNLDGGGSSTMVYQGSVINKPSDFTGERPLATGWCIYD